MDRNNVKWAGGVGPTGKNPPSTKDIQLVLESKEAYGFGEIHIDNSNVSTIISHGLPYA